MLNKVEELIEHFGSPNKLAGILDVSSAAISQWVKEGYLPPLRAIQIEHVTNGKFLAIDLVRGVYNEH